MDIGPGAIDDRVLLDLHRRMVRIRLFEEAAGRLAEANKLPGFLHLYVGEEAVAAGVCAALTDEDQITSTHRGHGHLIAKGGDFRRMMAELMGKATGYCKGKGGSMHISDLSLGILGANGIVGGGLPIAVGAGFTNRYRGTDTVSVAFFGDGASNIGAFHEAANMAAALALPVVFVCENNEYGEYTRRDRSQANDDVVDRAAGYGMPGAIVDGMDVVAVHEAALAAVARARGGGGPSMIEAKTYRFFNHHGVQNLGQKYRTDEEVLAARERDPITLFETRLADLGVLDADGAAAVRAEVQAAVDEAVAFAEESPLPDPAGILADVYSDPLEVAS
jgi:pyruvate dehydrogenase E1 component alpha subunit